MERERYAREQHEKAEKLRIVREKAEMRRLEDERKRLVREGKLWWFSTGTQFSLPDCILTPHP